MDGYKHPRQRSIGPFAVVRYNARRNLGPAQLAARLRRETESLISLMKTLPVPKLIETTALLAQFALLLKTESRID